MSYLSNYYYNNPDQRPTIKGSILPLATGALELGGNIGAANQEAGAIQTQSPGVQPMDEFGTPVYNLGSQNAYINSLRSRNYGRGLGLKGLATGAQTGAAIGGVPGAIAGGLLGGFVGLLGRGAARRKARRKIRIAKSNFQSAQRDFNEANISATQNRLGREQYNDMLSDPYGINGGYY